MDNFLPVSKATMPVMEELQEYLSNIYSTGIVTNNGPLVREFEQKMKDFLGVKHAFFVANGTWALQLAYRALGVKKKVVTTAFSAVPTLSSLLWENIEPVFADVDFDSFNISPESVEVNCTENTEAILATHVFGNPCDLSVLSNIAKKKGVKLIYDGAHAMGSLWQGNSVFKFGDISVLSLHAYKILNSIEGGFIFTDNDLVADNIYKLRYFGLSADMQAVCQGTNAKNSELHAAFGLSNLKRLNESLNLRKEQYEEFKDLLSEHGLDFQKISKSAFSNHSYFPVVFATEDQLLKAEKALHEEGFQSKRYFYPSLNLHPVLKDRTEMPVAERLASRILCLPHHDGVTRKHRKVISSILLRICKP